MAWVNGPKSKLAGWRCLRVQLTKMEACPVSGQPHSKCASVWCCATLAPQHLLQVKTMASPTSVAHVAM